MKVVRTMEEMLAELRTDRQWVIYGAGWAGKIIGRYFKSNHVPVIAYAVTNRGQVREIEEIPVRCLDDVLSRLPPMDFNIILAVTEHNRLAMEEELERRRVASYIEISELLLYRIVMENRKLEAKKAEAEKRKNNSGKTVGYLTPGYLDTDYAEQRLIIDRIESAAYEAMPKETADITLMDVGNDAGLERYRQLSEACYCPELYVPEVELIHTFNMVCRTDKPWCVSFETTIPRVWPKTESEEEYYLQLVEYMKRPNCKALYALCRNAYEIHSQSLARHISRQDVELLMGKTKILHPPQPVLVTGDEFVSKHGGKEIHFLFVGSSFFIKGGKEVIKALSKFEDQYAFKLTLVSSLLHNDYFTKTPYEEAVKWKEIIQEKSWIDYYAYLPNGEVLKKCKEATVGLLPSVADTYGYAVLEMQAAGCPVITTNVRAFPEINSDKCGWICQIPVNALGCCAEPDSAVWSMILERELSRCFQDIFEHPEGVKEKGRLALERIRKMHDPNAYQKELRKNL